MAAMDFFELMMNEGSEWDYLHDVDFPNHRVWFDLNEKSFFMSTEADNDAEQIYVVKPVSETSFKRFMDAFLLYSRKFKYFEYNNECLEAFN